MDKFNVENLDLYYGQFKALKDVSIKIPDHEITAFIGPSGCGKSTLLKSLNRMNDLVEGCSIKGTVLLDGEDIYGKMDVNLLRKRVGMVLCFCGANNNKALYICRSRSNVRRCSSSASSQSIKHCCSSGVVSPRKKRYKVSFSILHAAFSGAYINKTLLRDCFPQKI